MTPTLKRKSATAAPAAIKADIRSNLPSNPWGQRTWWAKNMARFKITPTTAAVIADRGAVNGKQAVVQLDYISQLLFSHKKQDGELGQLLQAGY